MPKTQNPEQHQAPKKDGSEALNAVIGRQVIRALGDPADLLRVQVRWVWEDHYRVNVFVGVNDGSARIAHSYLLGTDGDGTILASSPKITRQYGGAPPVLNL
jgi:hypothetical protein